VTEGNLPQSGNPTELGRLSQLSILLAGPLLRRVDTSQVCIWIACSRPVTVRAEASELQIYAISKVLRLR
jgi:hypothetical protein